MKVFMKSLALSFVFLIHSCGDGESFIENIVYNVAEEDVEVGVEFNDYLDIELETSIPIKKYGTLNFIPAGRRTGAILSFSLDMDVLEDDDIMKLKKTRHLPNGARMSSYIESDLLWLDLKQKKSFDPSFYLGTEIDDFYVGAAIQFTFIDEDFPERLTITQRFRDAKGRLVGVMSIFGPRLKQDDTVKEHGGIFFATNATDLKEFIEEDRATILSNGVYSTEIEIKKDGEDYEMSDKELRKLAKKLNKKIKEFNKSQEK